MVDSELPTNKTYKELEKELRFLLNKRRINSVDLKKLTKKDKKPE